MARKDFKMGYQMKEKKELFAVVCVYHPLIYAKQKHINSMLEMVQKELKEEASYYEKVHVAYVYESPYLEVKDFHDMDHNTPIYYKEPCEGESHDLVHVLFMGLMLLKELQDKHEESEKRLYLLTEERFERTHISQIVYKNEEEIKIHPLFEELNYQPILIKTEMAGGDILEEYFADKNGLRPVFKG